MRNIMATLLLIAIAANVSYSADRFAIIKSSIKCDNGNETELYNKVNMKDSKKKNNDLVEELSVLFISSLVGAKIIDFKSCAWVKGKASKICGAKYYLNNDSKNTCEIETTYSVEKGY